MRKLTAPQSGEVCSYCNKYIPWGKTYYWIDKEPAKAFTSSMTAENSYIACNPCYKKMCEGEKLDPITK